MRPSDPDRTVATLLRCYPPRWRNRYGAEFAELLRADLLERPHCPHRTFDVVRAGIRARVAAAEVRILAMAAIGFVGGAASLLAQLIRGSLAHADAGPFAGHGVTVLAAAAGYFVALGVLALAPVAVVMPRELRRSGARLFRPLAVCLSGATVFALGVHDIAAKSPMIHDGGVLARVGDYSWAAALPISTFWVHPHRLAQLPAGELAWMCLSPVAMAATAYSAATALRRVRRSGAVVRFHRRLATAATLGMAPTLAAGATWVISSQHTADLRLRAGTLDLALIGVMAAATVLAARATDRAHLHR